FFFFSSRRRHTRSTRDWSSDVCSSDLFLVPKMIKYLNMSKLSKKDDEKLLKEFTPSMVIIATSEDNKKSWVQSGQLYEKIALERSEERRVGKEYKIRMKTDNIDRRKER